MKEKLIAFTRNKKNRVNLIIANIIIIAIVIAAILFLDVTKIDIVVRVITGILLILIVLWNYLVSKLFSIDEMVIRKNKMPIIFMAYSDIIYWILVIILLLITKGQVANTILFILILIAFIIISECISGYFRKKIKK